MPFVPDRRDGGGRQAGENILVAGMIDHPVQDAPLFIMNGNAALFGCFHEIT
jgi:hypothetical protein